MEKSAECHTVPTSCFITITNSSSHPLHQVLCCLITYYKLRQVNIDIIHLSSFQDSLWPFILSLLKIGISLSCSRVQPALSYTVSAITARISPSSWKQFSLYPLSHSTVSHPNFHFLKEYNSIQHLTSFNGGFHIFYFLISHKSISTGHIIVFFWSYTIIDLSIYVLSHIHVTPWSVYPTRFLCPLNFPGKDTRVGCHFLLQEMFQRNQKKSYHCSYVLFFFLVVVFKIFSLSCSVAKLSLTLHIPMNCSKPGFPVSYHLPEFTQFYVH